MSCLVFFPTSCMYFRTRATWRPGPTLYAMPRVLPCILYFPTLRTWGPSPTPSAMPRVFHRIAYFPTLGTWRPGPSLYALPHVFPCIVYFPGLGTWPYRICNARVFFSVCVDDGNASWIPIHSHQLPTRTPRIERTTGGKGHWEILTTRL